MPSAASIVQDIVNGSINEFGVYPNDSNHGIMLNHDLTKEVHLRMGYGFIKCEFAGTKVSFKPTRAAHLVDGTFAEFDDSKSVVALVDHGCRIAVSGFFSGCEWQIYKVKPATYYCIHVPRGAGKPSFYTDEMAAYANKANWTLVGAYPSAGAVQTNGETVWFVSQLFPNQRIETVRVVIGAVSMSDFNQGLRPRIVRTQSWSANVT